MAPTLLPGATRDQGGAPIGRRGGVTGWGPAGGGREDAAASPRCPDMRSPGPVEPGDVPRLVAWLRAERPGTTTAEVWALLADLPDARVRRLERVLDDLARSCRPPAPADLAALTELDERLARGPSA